MDAVHGLITNFMTHLPSAAELMSAVPVILSLVLIAGLPAADNAMAIAAMASVLPKNKQKLALRLGIIGAYAFRGISLGFVAFIAENHWLKFAGACYLVYLMCHGLLIEESEDEGSHGTVVQKSMLVTIIQIEIMDLSLSLDNVVAAVAMDKRLWVVCTGVFIGILALRFIAGYCIRLIERFPILKKTAFLLIGFVGAILAFELTMDMVNNHVEVTSFEKFLGIITITTMSLLYGHTVAGRKWLGPVVTIGMPAVVVLNKVLSYALLPFEMVFVGLKKTYKFITGGDKPHTHVA